MSISAGKNVTLEKPDDFGKLLQDEPERDDAAAADRVTEDVLRLFGLPADEAHDVCTRPLPDIDDLALPDSA